jgi:hypothetical protein
MFFVFLADLLFNPENEQGDGMMRDDRDIHYLSPVKVPATTKASRMLVYNELYLCKLEFTDPSIVVDLIHTPSPLRGALSHRGVMIRSHTIPSSS